MIEAGSHVDLTVRDARLNDAARLAALACELGYKTTGVEMATRLETFLKDARYKTFVAEIGEKLCGIDRHGFALELFAQRSFRPNHRADCV